MMSLEKASDLVEKMSHLKLTAPAHWNDYDQYLHDGGHLGYRDWLVSKGILPDPIGECIDDTFYSHQLADLTVALQVAIAKEDGLQPLTEAEEQLLGSLLGFAQRHEQIIKAVLRGEG